MKKAILISVFFGLFLVQGCLTSGPGAPPTGGVAEVAEKIGGAASGSWCTKGASWSWANPTTGEQASLVVQGIVSYEGRSLCKAVWEGKSAEGKDVKMEQYFDEGGKYSRMLSYENGKLMGDIKAEGEKITMKAYDAQGNVVQEFTSGG